MSFKTFVALSLTVFLASVACLSGCAGNTKDGPIHERRIRVVTTTAMITDAVNIVAGDRVEVHGLMPPGSDPHTHEASAGDVRKMEKADIILYNGLHLEGKMGEVFEKMSGRTKTVAVTDGIPRAELRAVPGFDGGYDPHVWFDVTLWMKVVEHIRDSFVALDPTHADGYRANAKKYLAELTELHGYVQKQAARIPKGQRVLVTAHDAF
jgi:manganese/zinc/iron transport system substrate-binding protein